MQGDKGLLRLLTCGSVDDGKSSLIGRLLYECGAVPDDQLETLAGDSRRFGTTGGALDFALLVDGLEAEREQGMTIDVAYRYFATPRRKFIVADTPGHEQYTRNMATGASVSDLAIIVVDARKGISRQTRRHSAIVAMFGIKHVVLAVNKMDLAAFDADRFAEIETEYRMLGAGLGLRDPVCIPIVARDGDNVTTPTQRLGWYRGPMLLEHLEAVDTGDDQTRPLRLPVQWVNRPDHLFRGFSGTVGSGEARVGDDVVVLPSGVTSRIARILVADAEHTACAAGDAVTLVLADDVDVSRGDVIARRGAEPGVWDQFVARLVWMSDEPMLPGRPYLLKCATQTTSATVTQLKGKLSVETLELTAGRQLELNEIGVCALSTARPIVGAPFAEDPRLGAFILIDKLSFATVAAGIISHDLRRATNIQWQALEVDKAKRSALKAQKPCCLWFTGLSGAGKSTIANLLDKRLVAQGRHTYVLDGGNVRHGLNRDLGFTDADRVENIRRVAEVAKLMVDAGLIVIVSFISPSRAERRMARDLFPPGEFIEVFVDAPLDVCEARDAKGLYRKARAGQIRNFTGIDSAYEAPDAPELRLASGQEPAERLADEILELLKARRVL